MVKQPPLLLFLSLGPTAWCAAGIQITDQSAAIAEATQRGLVKTSPDMSAYREAAQKTLESTGELLPGVEVKPEGTSFTWRAIKKGEE